MHTAQINFVWDGSRASGLHLCNDWQIRPMTNRQTCLSKTPAVPRGEPETHTIQSPKHLSPFLPSLPLYLPLSIFPSLPSSGSTVSHGDAHTHTYTHTLDQFSAMQMHISMDDLQLFFIHTLPIHSAGEKLEEVRPMWDIVRFVTCWAPIALDPPNRNKWEQQVKVLRCKSCRDNKARNWVSNLSLSLFLSPSVPLFLCFPLSLYLSLSVPLSVQRNRKFSPSPLSLSLILILSHTHNPFSLSLFLILPLCWIANMRQKFTLGS